jgi:hypothetical protein
MTHTRYTNWQLESLPENWSPKAPRHSKKRPTTPTKSAREKEMHDIFFFLEFA